MCCNVCGQICNVEEPLELFETGEVGCFRGVLTVNILTAAEFSVLNCFSCRSEFFVSHFVQAFFKRKNLGAKFPHASKITSILHEHENVNNFSTVRVVWKIPTK
jgi:hypothetical protein